IAFFNQITIEPAIFIIVVIITCLIYIEILVSPRKWRAFGFWCSRTANKIVVQYQRVGYCRRPSAQNIGIGRYTMRFLCLISIAKIIDNVIDKLTDSFYFRITGFVTNIERFQYG